MYSIIRKLYCGLISNSILSKLQILQHEDEYLLFKCIHIISFPVDQLIKNHIFCPFIKIKQYYTTIRTTMIQLCYSHVSHIEL